MRSEELRRGSRKRGRAPGPPPSASSADVTARLLAIAGIRGDGAGTVIVGRAFHEVTPETSSRRPQMRDAVLALAAILAATIVAILMLHSMFAAT